MAGNLVVLAFEGERTARAVWDDLARLQQAGAVEIEDAVIAWRAAARAPDVVSQMGTLSESGHAMETAVEPSDRVHIEQTQHPATGKSAGAGAAIGLVAGLLLGGPIGGLAVGAGLGAIGGRMKDCGIEDKFVEQTAGILTPGSSAIFMLGRARDQEQLLDALRSYAPRVLTTTLDPEQERRLRAALGS